MRIFITMKSLKIVKINELKKNQGTEKKLTLNNINLPPPIRNPK